ncbi:hypothetical protein D3C71_1994020 [compost metagenome]
MSTSDLSKKCPVLAKVASRSSISQPFFPCRRSATNGRNGVRSRKLAPITMSSLKGIGTPFPIS